MFLLTNWTDSNQIDFKGGSELDLNKDFGWGFGFAYNLNEHIAPDSVNEAIEDFSMAIVKLLQVDVYVR